MNKIELEKRTKKFALDVISFYRSLPRRSEYRIIGGQFLRSGTSIAANYREANRAFSRKEFASKIGIVEKEAAETEFWLDLTLESGVPATASALQLLDESRQLLRIFTRIGATLRDS